MSAQGELFGSRLAAGASLPAGMTYEPGFIGREEESALLEHLETLEFTEAKHREYTAKRRIALYQPEVPRFLLPLRDKVAARAALPPQAFVHALVNEYRPGTPLGWHRDSPEYGVVAGVSLGGWCTMRLRPYPPKKGRNPDVLALELAPRSAYLLRDEARWQWQHSIAATKELRYSISFRTMAGR